MAFICTAEDPYASTPPELVTYVGTVDGIDKIPTTSSSGFELYEPRITFISPSDCAAPSSTL